MKRIEKGSGKNIAENRKNSHIHRNNLIFLSTHGRVCNANSCQQCLSAHVLFLSKSLKSMKEF